MNQGKNESNSVKSVRKSTKVQNQLRNFQSGNYYARFKAGGKQKWLALKTGVYSVAKLRLHSFDSYGYGFTSPEA